MALKVVKGMFVCIGYVDAPWIVRVTSSKSSHMISPPHLEPNCKKKKKKKNLLLFVAYLLITSIFRANMVI